MEKRRAIYPGSFDPVTHGHLDIIRRARLLFDEVIVVVARNTEKDCLFTAEERVELMLKSVKGLRGVTVDNLDGLTIRYAQKQKATAIIRGLRATSDFDYEFQMALTNRRLSKQIETVFLMPSESYFYLSSRLIREIASLGGDISDYVPTCVADKLSNRLAR